MSGKPIDREYVDLRFDAVTTAISNLTKQMEHNDTCAHEQTTRIVEKLGEVENKFGGHLIESAKDSARLTALEKTVEENQQANIRARDRLYRILGGVGAVGVTLYLALQSNIVTIGAR